MASLLVDPQNVSLFAERILRTLFRSVQHRKKRFNPASPGCILCSTGMPRLTYPKRRAIKQALEMQDSCFACVKALEADLRESADKEQRARIASAIGGLGRNWTALQDAVRVLKGDPLPGSLKPVPKPTQPKKWSGPIAEYDEQAVAPT